MAGFSLSQQGKQSLKGILVPVKLLLCCPEVVKHVFVASGESDMEGKEFVDFVCGVKTGHFHYLLAVHSAVLEQKLDHVKVSLKDGVSHWIPLQLYSI